MIGYGEIIIRLPSFLTFFPSFAKRDDKGNKGKDDACHADTCPSEVRPSDAGTECSDGASDEIGGHKDGVHAISGLWHGLNTATLIAQLLTL